MKLPSPMLEKLRLLPEVNGARMVDIIASDGRVFSPVLVIGEDACLPLVYLKGRRIHDIRLANRETVAGILRNASTK